MSKMQKLICPHCNEKIQIELSYDDVKKIKPAEKPVPYARFKQIVDERNKLRKEINQLKKK